MNGTCRAIARAVILGIMVQGVPASAVAAPDDAAQNNPGMSIEQMIARAPGLPPASLYRLAGRLFAASRRDGGHQVLYRPDPLALPTGSRARPSFDVLADAGAIPSTAAEFPLRWCSDLRERAYSPSHGNATGNDDGGWA